MDQTWVHSARLRAGSTFGAPRRRSARGGGHDLDLLTEAEADGDEDFLGSALELAESYAAGFPRVMARAGLSRLSTHGPASVVAVLVATGERGIMPRLLEVIDARCSPVDVVIAFVDCLSELGGEASRAALEELQEREGLDPEVVKEIGVALQIIADRGRELCSPDPRTR